MDKNLTIRITGNAPSYIVLAETDGSGAEGRLELQTLLTELTGTFPAVGSARALDLAETAMLEVPRADPRILGAKLFRRLFAGSVGELLNQALGSAEHGVRVRLIISTSDNDTARVAGMPWEILTRDEGQTPLACDKRTVLVRSIDIVDETRPVPFEPPLRLLLIVSNPTGTAPLDLAREKSRIAQVLGDVRGVEVVTLERATKEAIGDALATKPFHVVHFMGHGDFDPATGRGAVLLERDDRSMHRVEAEEFRIMLEAYALRLVFLNACKTATTSTRGVINPFGGVAASLMAGGIPAVIAMQFPISDEAAIRFSTTFYKRLVQGMPVDSAVAEARRFLWSPNDAEWATPVLFLRPKHGVLFDVGAGAGAPSPEPVSSVPNVTAPSAPAVVPNGRPAAAAAFSPYSPPAPSAAEPKGGPEEFRVFLAATSERVRNRGQVIKELRAAGIAVLPAVPNPDEPDEWESPGHDERVRALARQADLFVHVFGGDAGDPLADADPGGPDPHTFPVRQLALGAQLLKPQLVLVDDTVVLDTMADGRYRAFLGRQQHVQRERSEYEVRVERLSRVGAAIVEKRDRMVEERRRRAEAERQAAAPPTAFVDVHMGDYPHSFDLLQHLQSRGIMPMVLPALGDPTAPDAAANLELFERYVRTAPLVILFYGNVGYEWITNRLEIVSKIKFRQRLKTRIGVYVAPPAKSDDDLNFTEMFPTARNMEGFDAAAVDALLSAGRP
jgi:hypothetical protein